MAAPENKTRFGRAFEGMFNEGDLAVVDDLYDPNFVGHVTPQPIGREGLKQMVGMFRKAFPDIQLTVEDQVAEGDKVASRWTARGTHRGEFMSVAPTGRQATITGITINRWVGGRIVEGWTNLDLLGLLQQLGALPTPRGRDQS